MSISRHRWILAKNQKILASKLVWKTVSTGMLVAAYPGTNGQTHPYQQAQRFKNCKELMMSTKMRCIFLRKFSLHPPSAIFHAGILSINYRRTSALWSKTTRDYFVVNQLEDYREKRNSIVSIWILPCWVWWSFGFVCRLLILWLFWLVEEGYIDDNFVVQ